MHAVQLGLQALEQEIVLAQQSKRSTEWPRKTALQGSRPREGTPEGCKLLS